MAASPRVSPRVNFRAIALVLVGVLVMLMLAVPIRSLIQERREIKILEQQVASKQSIIDELNNRKARLTDPAYIQALARERLNYVFPGEIGFVVLDEETNTAITSVPGALVPNNDAAWYTKLWTSTKLADQPALENDPLVVPSDDMPQ
ncbi:MAG: septum formation initiator family protein [Candidatus Nanopelagicales bacterium]|nr:septum formation initiator family protein [Candidatus Nanopelagicales bacterium]